MIRGDIVSVASRDGDYTNKPRPALIIQADVFSEHNSVIVLPITSVVSENTPLVRFDLFPNEMNGLRKFSQIQIDKITTLKRTRIGPVFGKLEHSTMIEIERLLAVILGLG